MTDAVAREAGVRTGLFTSPHLCRVAERIRIHGVPLSNEELARVLGVVEDTCRVHLTFFETLTVAAFVAFAEASVELAILEVGLGGRLDATNVVRQPLVTAITSIDFDHMAWLGHSLAAIAHEKAGILKPGAPVILGPLASPADDAIEAVATRVGAGPRFRVTRAPGRASGRVITVRDDGGLALIEEHVPDGAPANMGAKAPSARVVRARLGLRGPHQMENAGVAAGIAWQLAATWPTVSSALAEGLTNVTWPGRFERLLVDGVDIVLDCAHNPHGAAALVATLKLEGIDPSRTALVFGALADKAWPDVLGLLVPCAARRYYAEPRGRTPASLKALCAVADGICVGEPRATIRMALAESPRGNSVVVAGSIYLVGEVRGQL